MRIRTLAGPPLPHELVIDTVRAILLSHSIPEGLDEAPPRRHVCGPTVQPTQNRRG